MSGKRKKTIKASSQKTAGRGTLFVVATPIGNLEDITFRALRILKEVDLIAAEDTRHTRKLLANFNISTPTLSYYKEKEQERSVVIINKLLQGHNIALVSDAGTPGISDPGSILVKKAASENIKIEPVPGLKSSGRIFCIPCARKKDIWYSLKPLTVSHHFCRIVAIYLETAWYSGVGN
jgi:16S rRNA C1402 (ribose-2'-O) methylase RsmI